MTWRRACKSVLQPAERLSQIGALFRDRNWFQFVEMMGAWHNRTMRPGPLSRPLLRTLPVLGFILVLLGMFQNFDIKDIEEFSRLQQQNQPRPIGATSLGGAAEELFVTRYAPEALEFRDRLGERMTCVLPMALTVWPGQVRRIFTVPK